MKLMNLILLVALAISSVARAGFIQPPQPTTKGGTGQTTYTDGQLLIGKTSTSGLAKTTLTAGSGISITNGSGTITVATTGGSSLKITTLTFNGGSTTTSCTGTCTLSNNNNVSTFVRNGAGQYTLTFSSAYTVAPSCTCSSDVNGNIAFATCLTKQNASSTTAVDIWFQASGGQTDSLGQIICIGS